MKNLITHLDKINEWGSGSRKQYRLTGVGKRAVMFLFFLLFGLGVAVSQVLIPFSGTNSISCGTNTTLCTHAGCGVSYGNSASGYTVINSASTAVINISGSYSTELNYDYIRIYAGVGTGGTLLATYHGSGTINYTGVAGQTLTIQFTSDGSVTSTGLNATITFSGSCSAPPSVLIPFSGNNSIACGTNSTLCTHAGCGATYNPNANGYTVINAAGTAVITISGSYYTETGYDYIRIYSGTGTGGTLLATYAGNSTFTYSGTAGQTLTVQFTSDGSVQYTGLNATVTFTGSCEMRVPASGNNSYTACSGHLYDNGGSAGNYGNNQDGYTVIYPGSTNMAVQLTGTYVTESCCEHIYIYDGAGTGGTLLYNGGNGTGNIGTITSSGPNVPLTVRFTTDVSVVYAGFDFTIACVCKTPGTPGALSGAPTGATTATLTWSAGTPAGSPTVTYFWNLYNSGGTFITSGNTTGTSAAVTGLACGTTYYFTVYASTNCNSTNSSTATSGTFTTTACEMIVPYSGNNSYTTCSGTLYDHGGSGGSYLDYANGYTVLYPTIAGNKIQVSGTTSGESCCDYVRIYNGVGTGGTILGTYYMNTAIPALVSTDPTGALTVLFYSDVSVVGSGFSISISCVACVTPGTPGSLATTSIGETSANLSWAAGSPAGSSPVTYYWVVGTSPSVVYGSGIAQGTTTTTGAVASGLTCGTTYYFRVYANTGCNSTSSAYATSGAFTTSIPAAPTPITASPATICVGSTSTLSATAGGTGLARVLVIYADASGDAGLAAYLAADSRFQSAAVWDGASTTPSPADLSAYDVVVTWGNSTYADCATLGNNLASFVDAGGGVVVCTFGHYSTSCWGLGGTFLSNNYDPIQQSTSYGSVTAAIGTVSAPAHPIISGVTDVSPGWNFYTTTLTAGASPIFYYNNGYIGCAVKTIGAGRTVGLNQHPGSDGGAHADLIIANAAAWAANASLGISWYTGSCGGTLIGTGNTLNVTPSSTTTYYARIQGPSGCWSTCGSTTVTVNSPSTAGVSAGDYLWTGNTSTDWNIVANWLTFDGTNLTVATVLPTNTNNVFIRAYGSCASNIPTISTAIANCRSLTIESGKTLIMAGGQTLNVSGNFINNGTFTAGNGSVVFNGTTNQSIACGASNFFNVTFSNTAAGSSDITLLDAMNITGSATFTNGVVNLSGGAMNFSNGSSCNGGSAGSFVTGPVTKIGTSAFIFPVGKVSGATEIWAPLGISAPGMVTDRFSCEYFFTASPNNYNPWNMCDPATLHHTSGIEYWNLTRDLGSSTPNVTLYWKNAARSEITDVPNLVVAHYEGCPTPADPLKWKAMTSVAAGTTGVGGMGSVVGSGFTGYSPVTFGTKINTNPLPVNLISFESSCRDFQTILTWTTATETNNDHFIIERSEGGETWDVIGTVLGAGNSNQLRTYTLIDEQPLNGISYYRLSQFDFNGKSEFFAPITSNCASPESEPQVYYYPNPFTTEVVMEMWNISAEDATVAIYNALGELVMIRRIAPAEINAGSTRLDLSELPAGIYTATFTSQHYYNTGKIIKGY